MSIEARLDHCRSESICRRGCIVRNMRRRRPNEGVQLVFNLKWVDIFRELIAKAVVVRTMLLTVTRNWWCAKTTSLRVAASRMMDGRSRGLLPPPARRGLGKYSL